MDQNQQNQQSDMEKREARRKRRVRNQILAYVTVAIFILALAVGIVFGVQALTKESKKQEEAQLNQVEQMIGQEESLQETESVSVSEPDVVPEPEPVPELTPQQKLDELVNAGIEVMPLEDKVAGLFVVTPESITGVGTAVKAGEGTKKALTEHAVGGIVYSAKNIQSEAQIKEMIDNTKLYANYPLFVAIEDEGGKISPLAERGLVTKQNNAKVIADAGTEGAGYEAATATGMYLSDYGFNLNFAPVADLNSVENSIMKDRAYGADAQAAAAYVAESVKGLEEQGVSACLKHFPGLGATTQNPDNGLATTERTADDFRAGELTVFKAGIDAGVDMIMVSHMAAPSLAGDNTPSSMSSVVVTDVLRKELGYDGVIITDSMSLKAISDYYGADEAAVMALKAGCDMILMPEDYEKAYNGVLEAVQSGVISEERIDDALRRIYRIKYADRIQE